MEDDKSVITDAEEALRGLKGKVNQLQLNSLLSGEADANDTYLEINSGAGGTESQDWAEMLERMYMRWAERAKFKVEVLEEHAGEEAGIKSATLLIKGHNAYGWAKTESGVHRLVRISPYDSQARRHTSFASVWVYPVVDDTIDIQVNESDCRIDTYRASGEQDSKSDIGWGHQIRSYVLQPYQMVKDLRTGVESTSPQDVLDGDIDAFMEAALAQRVHGGKVDVEDVE